MSEAGRKIPASRFVKKLQTGPLMESAEAGKSQGFGRETAKLFVQSPAAVFFLVVIVALVLGAVLIPFFCPFSYAEQNITFTNQPFFSKDPASGFTHIFGTDHLGRDIFTRLWYGARISLTVAGAVALIDCVAGTLYGCISGYLGGGADTVMMRLLEIVNGIPYMIVVLLLMAVLPRGVGTLIVAYSLVGWTSMARLVRSQVLSLKRQDFYMAAKIMGAGLWRMIFVHLLPNMLGLMIVHISLDIPGIIFTEAFLSMLGMGVPPPYPSIGVMIKDGASVFQTYPLQLAVPGLFICLLMLAFNLLGDRLQDVLNPKVRRTAPRGRSVKGKKPKRVF